VKHSALVPGVVAVCLALAYGCASSDDMASDDEAVLEDDSADSAQLEGDFGSSEQALTMPVNTGGSSQSCISACTRFSSVDITGQCCVCNGATKLFARSTINSTLYMCK